MLGLAAGVVDGSYGIGGGSLLGGPGLPVAVVAPTTLAVGVAPLHVTQAIR